MKRLEKIMRVELKNCELPEVDAKVVYSLYNDGIGAYEYWGAKCFDRGTLCAEVDDIIPIFEAEDTEEIKDSVIRYINAHFNEIAETIEEKLAEDGRRDDY